MAMVFDPKRVSDEEDVAIEIWNPVHGSRKGRLRNWLAATVTVAGYKFIVGDRLEIDRLQRFIRRALRRDRENRGKKRQGKQDGNGGSESSHGDSLF